MALVLPRQDWQRLGYSSFEPRRRLDRLPFPLKKPHCCRFRRRAQTVFTNRFLSLLPMKSYYYNLPLIAAALIAIKFPFSSNAQDTERPGTTNGMSIIALVDEALRENPEVRFYEAEIEAAKAGRKTAGLLANPVATADIGRKSVRGSGLNAEGVAWSASVAQPFEWPGRMGLRKAIANRDVELAELGFERFKLALAARVRTLTYGLFASQEISEAAREVADRFDALTEVLVLRDPAGVTPLLETRVIEATALTIQHKATDATLAAQSALLELNQLRGANPSAALLIEQPDWVFGPVENVDRLTAMARTNNFELRVRAVELAQQGFRVELAKNERFPAIAVGPTISEERSGDRERVIGFSISVPLPLWNRNAGNIQAAQARQIQAETSFLVAWREVERSVVENALTYGTKLNEMAKWRPDSALHFRDAAAVADRHYRLGAVPISTYIELQKQYLEAVESLLRTKKEALEAALQIELLTGFRLTLAGADAERAKP